MTQGRPPVPRTSAQTIGFEERQAPPPRPSTGTIGYEHARPAPPPRSPASTIGYGAAPSSTPVAALDATLAAPVTAPSSSTPRVTLEALAPTVGLHATSAPASLAAPSAPTTRTTVLPRVELVGEQVQIVADPRPRYHESRTLGAGGVGEVVEALDEDIHRKVAIKRLLPGMESPSTVARFVEEIRTIGQLEHPNIVPVHDVGVDERGRYYFVMKRIDGETLESIIDKLRAGDPEYHARYGFERRMEIFEGVLEALHYAHAMGFIHRDLKPANVMVGAFGEVVVMDWGLAKRIRGDASLPDALLQATSASPASARGRAFETHAGAIMGTPVYMSPEQAAGRPLDERSDVYSASMLLYELLTLRHPLAEKETIEAVLTAVVGEEVPNAVFLPATPPQPNVPADLGWFVMRGLRKRPEERYPSVAAMLARLGRRREGEVPIECHITLAQRLASVLTKGIVRHPLLYTLSLLALVLGGIGGLVVAVLGVLG